MLITKAKIHARLRKAGLQKTYTYTTRIKGWHERVAGYHVGEDDKSIHVELWGTWRFVSDEERTRRETRAMEQYAAALAEFAPVVEDAPGGLYARKRCVIQKEV